MRWSSLAYHIQGIKELQPPYSRCIEPTGHCSEGQSALSGPQDILGVSDYSSTCVESEGPQTANLLVVDHILGVNSGNAEGSKDPWVIKFHGVLGC